MTHRFLKKIEGVSVPPKLITNNSTGSVDGVHQEPDYNPNMVVYRKVKIVASCCLVPLHFSTA